VVITLVNQGVDVAITLVNQGLIKQITLVNQGLNYLKTHTNIRRSTGQYLIFNEALTFFI